MDGTVLDGDDTRLRSGWVRSEAKTFAGEESGLLKSLDSMQSTSHQKFNNFMLCYHTN